MGFALGDLARAGKFLDRVHGLYFVAEGNLFEAFVLTALGNHLHQFQDQQFVVGHAVERRFPHVCMLLIFFWF